MYIDSKKIQWPARKLSIGGGITDRLTFQVGSKAGKGITTEVSSISEDRETNSYVICVKDPKDKGVELVWKVIRNPSGTVEIEYDITSKKYPDEGN